MTARFTPDLNGAAALLDASPDFRVLRRLTPRIVYHDEPWNVGDRSQVKIGLYVDVETTGLDVAADAIVEFAAVPFTYDAATGTVYEVMPAFSGFEEPAVPIKPEAAAVHGIAADMVKGQVLDTAAIYTLLHRAALVIAHNAAFDRPIIERRFPDFAKWPWACSYVDVAWERFGAVGKKLEHILLYTCGVFYDAHRAEDDCRAGIHALATASLDGRTAMGYLLDAVRTPTVRVWATDAPFEEKDTLKQRGYRWSPERRTWYRDVRGETAVREELAWLVEHEADPETRVISAKDRYTTRADR